MEKKLSLVTHTYLAHPIIIMSESPSYWSEFRKRWTAVAFAAPEVLFIGAVTGAMVFLGAKALRAAASDMRSTSKQVATASVGMACTVTGVTLGTCGVADCVVRAVGRASKL